MEKIKDESLRYLLFELWSYLSKRRKIQFILLLILTLFSAVAEVVSLGAVIPFIGMLTNLNEVINYPVIQKLASFLGVTGEENLMFAFTLIFAIAALVAGGMRMLLLWSSSRLAFVSGADLSVEIFRRTLYQPYLTHVQRNSSEVISGISNKVSASVSLLYQVLLLISSLVILCSIVLTLIAIDPKVALGASLFFGTTYILLTIYSKKKLLENSKMISSEQTLVIKILQEGLGGIRDVLLGGTQEYYSKTYFKSDLSLRLRQASNMFIGGSPRYFMESFGIMMIAFLAYSLSMSSGGAAFPVLGALALGAQRLLPALQNCYSAWSSILGNKASLRDTIEFLRQKVPEQRLLPSKKISLNKSIRLRNINFSYQAGQRLVLENISLEILKGMKVGLVGTTGSGKSTLIDILMGLLIPNSGEILIDNVVLDSEKIFGWQKNISHVPQSIYLSDGTLAENIALGIPEDKIDIERVKESMRKSLVTDFADCSEEGMAVAVGERGGKLSGGQRQRIGIARALYKKSEVLILDEATSALDNTTERKVMEEIKNLGEDLTVFIIAHRLSTIRQCDMIIELNNGRITATGNYEELLEQSPSFRGMALMDEDLRSLV